MDILSRSVPLSQLSFTGSYARSGTDGDHRFESSSATSSGKTISLCMHYHAALLVLIAHAVFKIGGQSRLGCGITLVLSLKILQVRFH